MAPALKLPLVSRLTIALAVAALVGAMVQFSPRVPLPVIGDPLTVKSEDGALMPALVTVPPLLLSAAQPHAEPFHFRICPLEQLLVRPRLVLPPKETDPPPVKGLLAVTVRDGCASMPLVTPPVAMLSVPLWVIGPPVSPAPLPTLVTVPVPGKVWPDTNVTKPLLLTSKAVP